ncbi:MAG TPA: VOC family protein [Thermoleophilaceae bacterium]|jgi:catechol 2,3-dioxygenase-like lactoylglutathione lyase family enzyme
MFDHVTIGASDRAASERFYDTVLARLGIERTSTGAELTEWDDFGVGQAGPERPVTRRLHIGFVAPSREHVDAFWRVGRQAGYESDGAPGPRPQYTEDYYGSFLLDPDGNSAEALHHDDMRRGGFVDHIWIRVADPDASERFYETIAPYAGFRVRRATDPPRVQVLGASGSFSLLEGEPSEPIHVAFPAEDEAAMVDPDGHNVELVHRGR